MTCGVSKKTGRAYKAGTKAFYREFPQLAPAKKPRKKGFDAWEARRKRKAAKARKELGFADAVHTLAGLKGSGMKKKTKKKSKRKARR